MLPSQGVSLMLPSQGVSFMLLSQGVSLMLLSLWHHRCNNSTSRT